MAQPSNRAISRSIKPQSAQLLTRILDQPDLVQSVRSLAPQTFGKLIHHIGLEDAGELVALATTEQLQKIFDDDLWRSARPGEDETFDAARFALWLEVMLEVGESFAARKLTELPEDLVMLALHRQILVIDIDALAVQMSSGNNRDNDSEQLDKALSSALSHEFDGYQVIARHEEGWDALLSVLIALDEQHHDFLLRIFERCAYASSELIEENGGLHNVLNAEEMLESDAAADREDRRASEGYVSPASAVSFLAFARTTARRELLNMTDGDPLTRAYFRNYRPAASPLQNAPASTPSAGLDKLLRELQAFEVIDEDRAPRPLLTAGERRADAERSQSSQRFKQALSALFDRDPVLHARRMQELSYLANVLIAGASSSGRSFRPFEAAEAAVAVCNLGCEQLPNTPDLIIRNSADKLFRIGWHVLFHDVVLPAARALEALLEKYVDQQGLGRLARDLKRVFTQGKPWLVRGKLELLDDHVDRATRITLQALIDECPRLVGSGATSASAPPEFIATNPQVLEAQELLSALSQRTRPF